MKSQKEDHVVRNVFLLVVLIILLTANLLLIFQLSGVDIFSKLVASFNPKYLFAGALSGLELVGVIYAIYRAIGG